MIGTDSLLWTRNYKLALVLAASLPSPSPLVAAIRLDIAGYIFGDGWRSDPGPLPVLYHRPFSLPLPIDCIFGGDTGNHMAPSCYSNPFVAMEHPAPVDAFRELLTARIDLPDHLLHLGGKTLHCD